MVGLRSVLPCLVLDSQAEAERRAWAGRQRGQRQTELVRNASDVCDWSPAARTAPTGGERRVSAKSVGFFCCSKADVKATAALSAALVT